MTFTAAGAAPRSVADAAAAAGINVSVSEAPWARLDMAPPNPQSVVRASPHYYNTDEELDRLVEVVAVARSAGEPGQVRVANTLWAVSSPDRTAPSMYPFHTDEHSAPAQWTRPTGSVRADPKSVHTPGVKWAP